MLEHTLWSVFTLGDFIIHGGSLEMPMIVAGTMLLR
jgi:hypothetical protein